MDQQNMTDFALVLLPGLDGTGTLFQPLLAHLPPQLRPIVVAYPTDQLLGYDDLLPLVLKTLPTSMPFVLLGESFSGPLALMAAARSPVGLRGVILCATFVRNPVPAVAAYLRHLVRGIYFRITPEIVRTWSLLGGHATPALRRLWFEATNTVSPHVLAHRVRAVLQVDVRPQLEICPVPILYLRATQDRVVSRRNGDDVIAGSSAAELVELAAPHLVLQVLPEAAAAAVSRFVASLPSNPPPERTPAAV
jgi:pimeloyl-[acyl-carrier protein] methyl ester esterase